MYPHSGLVAQSFPNSLRNISSTGNIISLGDDQVSGAVSLGFNFSFYGTTYSQAYISSNGFLTFNPGSDDGCCYGPSLPNSVSNPSNLIAGFWTDLFPLIGGNIRYQTTGTAGSRQFIVGYYDVPHIASFFLETYEMILFEGSNYIELQYGNVDAAGYDVTIGITNNGSTDALTLVNASSNLDVGVSNRGFLITHPVPSVSSVPGPLPLFGVAAAFVYSRKLRKRIARSKALPVVSAIQP